jgi:hypothetical protein
MDGAMTKASFGSFFSCDLEAIGAEERPRHAARIERLFKSNARERREVANGYAFEFPTEVLPEILEFLAQEPRCCSFLAFSLEIAAEGGPIALTIMSPAGGREVVRREVVG